MLSKLSLACAISVLFAVDAAAQVSYLPGGLLTPGNTQQTSNWRGARRHQMVFDPRAVPAMNGAISTLVLRADETQFATSPVQLDVSVLLSSHGVPLPSNVDLTSYSGNLGSDATVVVNSQRVNLPAGASATLPLAFAQPFPYQNGNPLLVQLEFTPVVQSGSLDPAWMMDAHTLPSTFWGINGATTGTACPAPGAWTVVSDGITDRLLYRWSTLPIGAGMPAFVLLGTDNHNFGGIALPLDLGPIGAPGCALRTSVEAVFGTSTVLGGGFMSVLASVPLPRNPRFTGFDLYAQVAMLDPTANAAGLRMSELQSEHLATPPAPILCSHAYGPFAAGFPNDVPELVARNHTLVLGLQ